MSISQHNRTFHSTVTALLKILNNISTPVDSGKAVALTLFDLSVAFNMIDHSILHDCLKDWFSVDGTVLTWIDSYQSETENYETDLSFSSPFWHFSRFGSGALFFTLFIPFYSALLLRLISAGETQHQNSV